MDDENKFRFVLTGSTQAVFWESLNLSRPNGKSLFTDAVTVTMDYSSSPEELEHCFNDLVKTNKLDPDTWRPVIDLLEMQSVSNLSQV